LWVSCTELLCGNVGWNLQTLSEHLHKSPSAMTRIMSPSRCPEAAQRALREGRIGIRDCYAISQLKTPEEQLALLSTRLNGATSEEIEAQGRKARRLRNGNTTPAAVKLSRIAVPLPTGTR